MLLGTEVQVFGIHIETGSVLQRLMMRWTSPLVAYADFTGDAVYFSAASDIEPKLPNITAQARSQYVLTYTSSNEVLTDTAVYREIEIRSHEPFKIYHKAGYYQLP